MGRKLTLKDLLEMDELRAMYTALHEMDHNARPAIVRYLRDTIRRNDEVADVLYNSTKVIKRSDSAEPGEEFVELNRFPEIIETMEMAEYYYREMYHISCDDELLWQSKSHKIVQRSDGRFYAFCRYAYTE